MTFFRISVELSTSRDKGMVEERLTRNDKLTTYSNAKEGDLVAVKESENSYVVARVIQYNASTWRGKVFVKILSGKNIGKKIKVKQENISSNPVEKLKEFGPRLVGQEELKRIDNLLKKGKLDPYSVSHTIFFTILEDGNGLHHFVGVMLEITSFRGEEKKFGLINHILVENSEGKWKSTYFGDKLIPDKTPTYDELK